MQRTPKDLDLEKATVTVGQLADMLGVGEAAVMKYAREGGMPKGHRRGRYPLKACVQWALARERAAAAAKDEDGDLIEERRRLIVEQRKAQELENAKTRGELISAETVGACMQSMAAIVATQLDGLAARVTPQVLQLRDSAKIQRLIFDECRGIRSAAARALAAYSEDLGREPDPEPAPEEERGGVGGRKPRAAARRARAGAVED